MQPNLKEVLQNFHKYQQCKKKGMNIEYFCRKGEDD